MATIGKVINTHGVKGGLKVFPYSDYPERVMSLSRVFFCQGQDLKEYKVVSGFVNGRFWVIFLEGINGIEVAQSLIGALLQIPLAERLKLPPQTYYFDEIIGLEVFTVDGAGLGRVKDILQTGGNDVYVVQPAESGAREVLIPALKRVVISIDMDTKRMVVDPPEGLL